jgi:hypothetical protein
MEFGPQPKQAAEESLKDLPRVKILPGRIRTFFLWADPEFLFPDLVLTITLFKKGLPVG